MHHRRGDPQEVLDELFDHAEIGRPGHRRARPPSRACSGRRAPSRRCRRPAPDTRRSAAARCDRRPRCCPGRGSRLRRRCCPDRSLRLTHQVKLSSSLWKAALEPLDVALPLRGLLEPIGEDRGPGMHRRIDVAEVPFVGRDLAVGVHVPLAQHQVQLLLAEVGIHQRQREHVERQVPGRIPGVLPLVRHRDDVGVVHVVPVRVASVVRRAALNGSAPRSSQPLVDVVVVELLGPEHAGERLPHDVAPGRRRATAE